ncbi:hypothetical protein ACVINW_001444 [Bradyrhizobium sp. USDA 4461]
MLHRFAALVFSLLVWGIPIGSLYAFGHPPVPLVSFFNHWDHHWYVWLRGDPTFEAVEVMSRGRGLNAPPLVWVFFTERAPPKRQTHYVNDKSIASVTGWEFRDIGFSTSGAQDEPLGLSVSLRDLQDRPVVIEIDRDPGVHLSHERGGLTNQIGHSGSRFLLLFFRAEGALAKQARVTVGDEEVSRPRPDADYSAPFTAAYSSNIMVGGFPLGDRKTTFDGPLNANSAVLQFHQKGANWVGARADHTTIELTLDNIGDLETYIHRDGDHYLEVRFVPPIPPDPRLDVGYNGNFFVSYDQFRDIASGKMSAKPVAGGSSIDWTFEGPDWLRGKVLRTQSLSDTDQTVRVNVEAVAADPRIK